jgi:hypothetical protein
MDNHHKNARLTVHSREQLAVRVLERGPGQGRSRRNSTFACGAIPAFLNYAAASFSFCVLWNGSYASQLIQR